MKRDKPSFAERIAQAEARAEVVLAEIVNSPGARPRPDAGPGAFEAASQRLLVQIEELRRVPRSADAVAPLETAIQRFLAHIDRLRRAPGSANRGSRAGTRVHDLEPVLRLIAELEGQQPGLLRDGEQARRDAEEWEKRAMLAVNLGDDGIARIALDARRACLMRAARHQGELDTIELSLTTFRSFVEKLRGVPE